MRSAANHSKEYASRLSQMGSVSDQCLELVERDATAQVAVGDAEHVSRELVTRVVRGHDVVLGQAYRDHPPELVDVDPSVPVMVVEAKSEPEPLSVDTEHQRPDANQELVAAESVPQGARTHARARRAAPCRTSEGRDARERRKSGVVCRGSVFTKCSGLIECRCWRREVSRSCRSNAGAWLTNARRRGDAEARASPALPTRWSAPRVRGRLRRAPRGSTAGTSCRAAPCGASR